jgi:RimJ/RimL family protein N-acetyltransferase
MSKGIQLRDVEEGDLPVLFQHQVDPDAISMAVVNPRNAEAFQAHWRKILGDPNVIAKAVVLDGAVVGHISCFRVDGQDEIGYWIAKEHWGKGIATRALAMLLEQVAIRPLHATTARHNAGSIRVLERCGFTLTGHHQAPGSERYPACEVATFILT